MSGFALWIGSQFSEMHPLWKCRSLICNQAASSRVVLCLPLPSLSFNTTTWATELLRTTKLEESKTAERVSDYKHLDWLIPRVKLLHIDSLNSTQSSRTRLVSAQFNSTLCWLNPSPILSTRHSSNELTTSVHWDQFLDLLSNFTDCDAYWYSSGLIGRCNSLRVQW